MKKEFCGELTLPLAFEDLDMHGRLKTVSVVHLGAPPVFGAFERNFDMASMRSHGIALIMFSMQLQTGLVPLAFDPGVKTRYRCRLLRYEGAHPHKPEGKPVIRWGIEMHSEIWARELQKDKDTQTGHLGCKGKAGEWIQAGVLHAYHIITRPVAPPEARHLDEAPKALNTLAIHPWPGNYPDIAALQTMALEPGETLAPLPKAQRPLLTFGMHQSDVNQHVNVHEGLRALENASTTLLYQAGQPVENWCTDNIHVLFRAPFFPGQRAQVRVEGQVNPASGRVLCKGGLWRLEKDDSLVKSPAIYGCLQGRLA